MGRVNLYLIIGIFGCILAGQFFSKKGALLLGESSSAFAFLSLGYAMLMLRGILWINFLKRTALYLAYALQSSSYVLVFVLSVIAFNESITINKFLGSVFIITGVLLVVVNSKTGET